MRKFWLALVMVAATAGVGACVPVTTPWVIPPQHIILDGQDVTVGGAEYRHQDFLTNNINSNTVTITFDGYKVLEGDMSEGQTREFKGGHYRNHNVSAMCISKPRVEDWVLIGCQVFIDGEKAVELSY